MIIMGNKEYEETIMSDQLRMRIISSCENLESFDEKSNTKVYKKAGKHIVVVAMAVVLLLTFSVGAVNNWDYAAVFTQLFGNSAENAAYTYSHPEVEVLSNTFEGLDIVVSGIAATDNKLYVLFDITATDGTIFDTTDIGDGGIYTTSLGNEVNLHNPRRCSTYFFGYDPEIETRKELNGMIDFVAISGGASFIDIPDGNELDNHMGIALSESFNLCDYPGSVVVISINSIKHNDEIVKEGTWRVQFTVPEQQTQEINLDVNKEASMLRNQVFDYTDSNEYVYDEVIVNDVKLNTLMLEFNWTSDDGNYLTTHTFHAWIEMKDGSTVGYPDITKAAYKHMLIGVGTSRNTLTGAQGVSKFTLYEPINVDAVKAIHIGSDLVISID
jgi:hypothetical protein